MDLNNRVDHIDEELKLIKNEIKQVLLEIQEQVLSAQNPFSNVVVASGIDRGRGGGGASVENTQARDQFGPLGGTDEPKDSSPAAVEPAAAPAPAPPAPPQPAFQPPPPPIQYPPPPPPQYPQAPPPQYPQAPPPQVPQAPPQSSDPPSEPERKEPKESEGDVFAAPPKFEESTAGTVEKTERTQVESGLEFEEITFAADDDRVTFGPAREVVVDDPPQRFHRPIDEEPEPERPTKSTKTQKRQEQPPGLPAVANISEDEPMDLITIAGLAQWTSKILEKAGSDYIYGLLKVSEQTGRLSTKVKETIVTLTSLLDGNLSETKITAKEAVWMLAQLDGLLGTGTQSDARLLPFLLQDDLEVLPLIRQ